MFQNIILFLCSLVIKFSVEIALGIELVLGLNDWHYII